MRARINDFVKASTARLAPLFSQGTARLAPLAILAGCALIAIATCWFVAYLTLGQDLGLDAARFLGVARSIGTTFSYEQLNFPATVFDPNITIGGPMMYIAGAAFALTHNIEAAFVAGTVSGTLVVLVGLALMRRSFVVLPAVFLLIWPFYYVVSTTFYGEIWSAGALLIGLWAMEQIQAPLTPRGLINDRRIWLACICFGVAVASKLLIGFAVFAVVFAVVYDQQAARGWNAIARNALRALVTDVTVCAASGAVFFVGVAFAVITTVRSVAGVADVPTAFVHYLGLNFGDAASTYASSGLAAEVSSFSSHPVLLLAGLAAVILLATRPSYALLVIITGGLWLVDDVSERRLVPMFLIILALGLREALRLAGSVAAELQWPAMGAQSLLVAVVIAFVLLADHGVAPALPAPDPQQKYAVDLVDGRFAEYHYAPRLVSVLRGHPYVLTDGWWRLPEITDFWGQEFYDRMAPENAHLWDEDAVLLFDRDNTSWPPTTVAENCGQIIYTDGPLVVCRPRNDRALDYQASAPPFPPGVEVRNVSFETAQWDTTTNMHAALSGPRGSRDYEYTGTGTSDDVESAILTVPVYPGRTYVFSAWVDPTKLTTAAVGDVGEFDLLIDTTDNRSTYAGVFSPVGPPARYSTSAWVCPEGVTRVNLVMQSIHTVIPRGQRLKFAEPVLSYAQDLHPVHEGAHRSIRRVRERLR